MKPLKYWLPPGLWLITAAPIIAAAHFLAVYASTAITCKKLSVSVYNGLRIGLIVFTIICLAGIVLVGLRAWRQWDFKNDPVYVFSGDTEESRSQFLGQVAFLLAAMSFIGVCYIAVPLLIVGSCQ